MGVIEQEKVVRPMTFQTVKTKAEQAIVEQFAAVAAALPGNAEVARIRREAIGRFAAAGLPHRRIEEWKYTDLRNMMKEAAKPAAAPARKVKLSDVNTALGALCGHDCYRVTFVDGYLDNSVSTLKALPKGLHIGSLSDALSSGDKAVAGRIEADGARNVMATLNAAFVTGGALVRVDAGFVVDKPLVLVFAASSGDPQAATLRNEIEIGAGARATIVEMHVTLGAFDVGQVNALTNVTVGDGAAVTHVKMATQHAKAIHLGTLFARLGKAASYRPFQLTMGGGITRNEISVIYGGEGGDLDLSGVFLGRGAAHIDTTLTVDHAVPRCQSREVFKGVLDGEAHGIFQGKIIVRPDAQKTDGKQMAQALMLSPDAEFSSKPELEIYADDVVCGHGSTAAELDDDLMFYLRSRGIPAPDARALLIESFIGEAVERIEVEVVREAVRAEALKWLGGNEA